MSLAERLKQYRLEHNYGLREVGRRSKLIHSTVWKAERGEQCRWETVKALAGVYGCNAAQREELRALWLALMSKQPADAGRISASTAAAEAGKERTAAAFARKLGKVLASVPSEDYPAIAQAIASPAIRRLLPSLLAAVKGDA